ncbi:hypothetical protein AS589_09525 [Empedobacter brevis]|uniref:hypothetical protein n=1 Tax=Empedobacter brevis TaxID=247 RepID=UPI00131FC806|nr:hypothetical protein [Empedobacter brevis]QHC84995.1 hypothetical protein AS589_09525 [Empedobacter brevis]
MELSNIITQDSVKYDFEEEINIKVVSINLTDFNQRFGTDIVLYYADEIFDPYERSKLADYFISTIPDLLFMVHNPFKNEVDEWKSWITWRKDEREKLFITSEIERFNKRNIEYCPLGITNNDEAIDFVKFEVNKLILNL